MNSSFKLVLYIMKLNLKRINSLIASILVTLCENRHFALENPAWILDSSGHRETQWICLHGKTKAHCSKESTGGRAPPVVTKRRNDLQPPQTTYNHPQPPTTTSKNSTTIYNHLKNIYNHHKQSNTILNKPEMCKAREITICHANEIREVNKTSTSS